MIMLVLRGQIIGVVRSEEIATAVIQEIADAEKRFSVQMLQANSVEVFSIPELHTNDIYSMWNAYLIFDKNADVSEYSTEEKPLWPWDRKCSASTTVQISGDERVKLRATGYSTKDGAIQAVLREARTMWYDKAKISELELRWI